MAASTGKTKTRSFMDKTPPPPPPPSYTAFFPGTTTTITGPPKDTVFYAIYPDSILQVTPQNFNSDHQELISTLHSIHLRILDIISPYTANYIFQHEPLSLSLLSNPNSDPNCPCSPHPLPHFHGKTKYGEALEDEWFITFLLFEISRRIPNLTIRVWDSDGEFLVFEGAEILSGFGLNSKNTKGRVFIRKGRVEIVPEDLYPDNEEVLGFLYGLTCLGGPGAPYSYQSFMSKRISEYPNRANAYMHRVRVRVPISVAKVLMHEPCLISLAIEGLCNRDDANSVKFVEKMERFRSGDSGNEQFVRVSVKMSRAMYAKLVQQTFEAPECYSMPPKTDSSAFVEAKLGMKIACGLEMMYQKRCSEGMEVKGSTWDEYRESLRSNGYFQDLSSKSKKYRRLSKSAHEYYTKISVFTRASETMNAPVRRIGEILALPHTAEEFKGVDLPPSDDDAWLYSRRDELKLAILKRQQQMKHFEQTDKTSKKARKKKGVDRSAAHFPVDRDSNAVDPEIERFRKYMESLRLRSEGTAGDADADFDYAVGYDYESDFSYDDFSDPFADDPVAKLMYASLMSNFISASEQTSDDEDEGTSSDSNIVEKENEHELTPTELKSHNDSFRSQKGLPRSASTLGRIGQQLPKDARNGPLKKGK